MHVSSHVVSHQVTKESELDDGTCLEPGKKFRRGHVVHESGVSSSKLRRMGGDLDVKKLAPVHNFALGGAAGTIELCLFLAPSAVMTTCALRTLPIT